MTPKKTKRQLAQHARSSLFVKLNSLMKDGVEMAIEELNDEERQRFLESNGGDLYETLDAPMEQIAKDFLVSVNEMSAEDYSEDKREEIDFRADLAKIYQPYLTEFYGLLSLCLEAIYHHREYMSERKAPRSKKQHTQYSVIIRLHARALRVSNEIESLIEAGYGTAALSRWRALHELATTIGFLVDNPDATDFFLEHSKILSYEAMSDYNKYSDLLKHKPYTDREIAIAHRMRNNLIKRHGKAIAKPYGWLEVYSKGELKNFRDMEQVSDQKHLRPYYRYASYGIHTNAKSLFSGEDYSALESDSILLVGASSSGMAEVMQLVPISIGYATIAILTGICPNAGSIITAKTILLKQEQLAGVFANMKLPDE